jgi:hypothetical protein
MIEKPTTKIYRAMSAGVRTVGEYKEYLKGKR